MAPDRDSHQNLSQRQNRDQRTVGTTGVSPNPETIFAVIPRSQSLEDNASTRCVLRLVLLAISMSIIGPPDEPPVR
ncbi:hypothetical protein OK016_28770 [Vibrio chagasii]|nr:hypothetical protein [Vibrio chagasii]